MQIAVLGIDQGKNSCSLAGLDQAGAVVKRWRMRPEKIPGYRDECGVAVHQLADPRLQGSRGGRADLQAETTKDAT